jgi:hypothetical protein
MQLVDFRAARIAGGVSLLDRALWLRRLNGRGRLRTVRDSSSSFGERSNCFTQFRRTPFELITLRHRANVTILHLLFVQRSADFEELTMHLL